MRGSEPDRAVDTFRNKDRASSGDGIRGWDERSSQPSPTSMAILLDRNPSPHIASTSSFSSRSITDAGLPRPSSSSSSFGRSNGEAVSGGGHRCRSPVGLGTIRSMRRGWATARARARARATVTVTFLGKGLGAGLGLVFEFGLGSGMSSS